MAREIINEFKVNDGQLDAFQIVLSYGWKCTTNAVPTATLDITFTQQDGTLKSTSLPLYWGDINRLSGAVKRAIKLERDTN